MRFALSLGGSRVAYREVHDGTCVDIGGAEVAVLKERHTPLAYAGRLGEHRMAQTVLFVMMGQLLSGFASTAISLAGFVLGVPTLAAQTVADLGRLTVTEVWEIDGHTRFERLSDVSGVAETPLGTVWIAGYSEILAVDPTDPSGTSDVVVAEGKGDGPGELLGADRIAITPDGHVAIHDLGRDAIEIYSAAGKPVRRVQLSFSVQWPKGFSVLASGDFVLSGGVPWIESAIHRFNSAGEHLGSWGDAAGAEEWLARVVGTGGATHASLDGSLVYSNGAPHSIVRYEFPPTGGGEPVSRTVAEVPGLLEAPGDAVLVRGVDDEGIKYTSFNVWYPQSHAVFALDEGRVLNIIRRKGGDGNLETVWQLFEPSHEALDASTHALVGEGIVSVPYRLWFLCGNGEILATRMDDLGVQTVVRLRMNVR